MNAKNRIKIVKRAEAGSESKAESTRLHNAENQPRNVARQVAGWVKEFQQRRVEEQKRSFESLFQSA
jgi:hypothetical protein